jgi:hypothetical protein
MVKILSDDHMILNTQLHVSGFVGIYIYISAKGWRHFSYKYIQNLFPPGKRGEGEELKPPPPPVIKRLQLEWGGGRRGGIKA